jgi:hypothetical protein
MVVQAEINLDERPPFGAFGFADQVHVGFLRGMVGLSGIALNAGADDVFPSGGAAAIARDDVIQIQIFPIENLTAILAGIFIAFKDVVPGEFDFFFRLPVIHEEQDDPGYANAEGNAMDGIFAGGIGGNITPFLKVKSAKGTIGVIDDDLGVPLKKKGEGASGSADVYRLP